MCASTATEAAPAAAAAQHHVQPPGVLRIRLLGGFSVWQGGRPVDLAAWRLRKSRALVKLLALAPGHRLLREQLIETLWPETAPDAGGNNLYYAIHVARRVLAAAAGSVTPGAATIRLEEGWVSLEPAGGLEVDAVSFEATSRTALRTSDAQTLEGAAALYGGELLPEDRYEDWADTPRHRLRGLYLDVLLRLAALHEREADLEPALAALYRVVETDPAHDVAHAGLVRVLAALGRRADALRHYAHYAERLRREYQSEPDLELRRFVASLEGAPAAGAPSVAARSTTLPTPLTRFIGREHEIARVTRSLRVGRLTTLTGPGGAGKTRLALECATRLAAGYPGGVWLVELAPVEAQHVSAAVPTALGLREAAGTSIEEALQRHFAALEGPALLVLDNCEHVINPCVDLVSTLLPYCAALSVLTTSRRPLGVMGETVLRVPPLTLPAGTGGKNATPRALRSSEAVRLFEDRAQLSAPGFRLTEEVAPAVAEIVRHLDGLPLAIELAAARTGTLPVVEIAARVAEAGGENEGRFGLLTRGNAGAPARHRSLRALLDWTYAALSARERRVFRRLGVFADGCTLEAAAAVCGDDSAGDVGDALTQLVECSLVNAVPGTGGPGGAGGAMRFTLLETLRVYAAARLQREEPDAAREHLSRRHAIYFGEHAAALEARTAVDGAPAVFAQLERDLDNCRSALRWAVRQGEPEIGLRLALELSRYWHVRGNPSEGLGWLEALLALERANQIDPDVYVRALQSVASLARVVGRLGEARRYQERYLALRRAQGDRRAIAGACLWLGAIADAQGDRDVARAATDECLAIAREIQDDGLRASALPMLARMAQVERRLDEARSLLDQWLALAVAGGERDVEVSALTQLGHVCLAREEFGDARRFLQRALTLSHTVAGDRSKATVLLHLGWLDYLEGEHARGVTRLRHALSLARTLGLQSHVSDIVARLEQIAREADQEDRPPRSASYGSAKTLAVR